MRSECEKFGALGLKVEDPEEVGPKFVVFDFENEMTNEDLMKKLYEKNLENVGLNENEYRKESGLVLPMGNV